MDIEIRKLAPDLAEDYVRFFDETPHNEKYNTKCYCTGWCSNEPEGVDNSTEEKRRAVAYEYVKAGNLQGYLAYFGGQVVGWCNANTKADCVTCVGWQYVMEQSQRMNSSIRRSSQYFALRSLRDAAQRHRDPPAGTGLPGCGPGGLSICGGLPEQGHDC